MITIRSGRRAVQGLGAPWEAWAQIGEHGVLSGGWGMTRLAAEEMAVAALRRDLSAAGRDDPMLQRLRASSA